MAESKSVSLRLQLEEIEQLQARAHALSANVAAVARELIRAGLAGGDTKALAEQMLQIDRRLVVLEQRGRDMAPKVDAIDRAARDLHAMFDALLKALSAHNEGIAP